MFDRIASAGATFDWLSPLITMIQNYRYRPSVGYSFSVDCGWSAYAISDLLNDHGVRHWGLHIYHNTILLRLRVAQADFSQYLFEQNGLVYSGGIVLPGDVAPVTAAPPPRRRRSADDLVGNVLESIHRVADKVPGR